MKSSSEVTTHSLPSGERYKLPLRGSLVGVKISSSGRNCLGSQIYDLEAGSFAKEELQSKLYWVKDVDDLLLADEFITYMACAAYTTVVVTSKGRLLISG